MNPINESKQIDKLMYDVLIAKCNDKIDIVNNKISEAVEIAKNNQSEEGKVKDLRKIAGKVVKLDSNQGEKIYKIALESALILSDIRARTRQLKSLLVDKVRDDYEGAMKMLEELKSKRFLKDDDDYLLQSMASARGEVNKDDAHNILDLIRDKKIKEMAKFELSVGDVDPLDFYR